jgi:hypothetical protein
MGDEVVDAVVVEADCVEHAGGGLDGARRRIAGTRFASDRFRDDGAETCKINGAGHFPSVAKGAGRDRDRIAERQAAECDGEIQHFDFSIQSCAMPVAFSLDLGIV